MSRLHVLTLAAALISPVVMTSSADAQRGMRQGRSSMRAQTQMRTRRGRANVQRTTTRTVRRNGRATTTTVRTNTRRTRYRNQTRVVVNPRYAPPARRHRARPAQRRGMVWIPGRWVWHGDHYDWQDGRWVAARRGQRYQAGRWVWRGNQYVWVQPRWVRAHRGHRHY